MSYPKQAASILDDLVLRQLVRSEADGGQVYYRSEGSWDQSGELVVEVAAV